MSRYLNTTPDGTKDLLFEESAVRRKIERRLERVFSLRGYTEVITPTLEFLDVFSIKKHMPVEQMYKFSDSKGRLIVLRPDLTVPIARLVSARLKGQTLPLRLYYNQPVFTHNRALSAKSDEIVQTGVEIIGAKPGRSDLEILATAAAALDSCDTSDYRIEVGHVGIFNKIINSFGISGETAEQMRYYIERKNYPALNDIVDNIEGAESLKQLPRLFGKSEVVKTALELFPDSGIDGILDYLKSIFDDLSEMGLEDKITLDLCMVNRADYYTGIVFRGYMTGFGEEVLSGGRYDNLLNEFGCNMEAVGFGINVDAVANACIKERRAQKISPPEVLVHADKDYQTKALMYVNQLCENGIVCEYSTFDSLDSAKLYAKKRSIEKIAVVSETVSEIYIRQ